MTATVEAYESAFLRVCFDREPAGADLAALGTEQRERFLLYRAMVRGRLLDLARDAFPRTLRAIGDAKLAELFTEHLAIEPPRSRFFREAATTFGSFLDARLAKSETERPWLAELARFETLWWQCLYADDPIPTDVGELDFDRVLIMNPVHRLVSLTFAVHEDPDAQGHFARRDVHVLVFRHPTEHTLGTFVLNAVTAELVRGWQAQDEATMQVVQRVAASRSIAIDETFIDGLCTVLADFSERGIVLGSR